MAILDKIKLSGTTYDIVDSTAIHSLDGYWTSGETSNAITAATEALAEAIAEQGYQTSGDVQNAISGKADTDSLATVATTGSYDDLLDKPTIPTVPTDVSAFNNDAGYITSDALSGYATEQWVGEQGYQTATDVQNAISGKADIGDIPSVTGYADAVAYDSSTQYMKFYHGGTGGTEVYSFDASPFLIDGMVESVVITSITSGGSTVEVLEITWNSAAGSQVTDIPLSDIFDPSNYYTKAEVDGELSGKVSTNTYTAYTAATDTALAGKLDTSVFNTYSGNVETEISGLTARVGNDEEVTSAALNNLNESLSGKASASDVQTISGNVATLSGTVETKQDQLVSGTNIKTINNQSILGSGDITIEGGNQVEVSGTTLVFL